MSISFRMATSFQRFAPAVFCVVLVWAKTSHAADTPSGESLYEQKCATCHGRQGEGTEQNYPQILAGERTVAQLARYIAQSMPPDEPQKLTQDESERVAAHIYSAFYSPEAQRKLKPPRIEISRLTSGQFQNTIADLMTSLYEPSAAHTEQGLRGNYASINENGDGKQVFSRIDPDIKFDFGESSPRPQEINPSEFAISWSGSIRVPVSGEYEFIVRSPNSFKLVVNHRRTALIDGWVKSGNETEFRGTIRLLAGRYYPIQLHFTKAGQGTKKPDALRNKPTAASIVLAWRPPGRSEQIIPPTYFSPIEIRPTLVVQTPFPPEDRSTGVERGTSVSAEWDQAVTEASLEATAYILENLGDLCGVVEPRREHEPVLKEFCNRLAAHAFRRPLTDEQRTLYIDRQFARAADPVSAIERSVVMMLKSPRFLYPDLPQAALDDYAVAARLALTLWDSLPDHALRSAAAAGQLQTREQIVNHARRMASDHRFENKLREFFIQWLKLEHARDLRKDMALYPEFNETVATDLRTSLDLYLENVLDDNSLDFRRFLKADFLYLNARLAPLYGLPQPKDDLFHKMKVNPDERAGLLTHPYLLAVFADAKNSSPIRRGVFLARSVLGRTLRPPPDAVSPVSPDLHPDLTTRERATLQTAATSCQTCHGLINPLGFALERFDAVGRFRETDNRRVVDATGTYVPRGADSVQFTGARELADYLVQSDEAHAALVEKLFQYFVKQPVRAYGPDVLPALQRDFVKNDFNLRQLLADMAVVAASRSDHDETRK